MPQATACGIYLYYMVFEMLLHTLAGLETDDLVHRQRENDAVRVRAQAAGVADSRS